ncbi:TSCPD domain-containing protein [Clostridium sp. HMSC19B04]|nr:TSCPD domain-containing protein [Clostridium sp. HMSC19B04]
MMKYKTTGTCATEIEFEVKENKVTNVNFIGGCDGNLKGLKVLVECMNIEDVIQKLKGIECKTKPTSCPDQLSLALENYMNIK